MRAMGWTCVVLALVFGCNDGNPGQSGDGGSGGGGPAQHTLHVHVTGSGQVLSSSPAFSCGTDCTQTLEATTTVHLSALPDTGWTFSGWQGACSGTGACDVAMSADHDVTATFSAALPPPGSPLVTVKFTGNGSGRVTSTPSGIDCPGACSMTVVSNSTVTLSAQPDSTSIFTGWAGGCSGTGGCSVTAASDVTVWATFSAALPPPPGKAIVTVELTGNGSGRVTSTPPGIDCPGACSMTVVFNSTVALSAQADANSSFAGWGGGCSGAGGCSVTAASDVKVWSNFTANDCVALAPGALPGAISFQIRDSVSSSPGFCGMPIGDANGAIALRTVPLSHMGKPQWTILSPSGQQLGSFAFWSGDAWPTMWKPDLWPGGFIGYGGSSTQQMVVIESFFESGMPYGTARVNGSAIFAPDPNGGLFAVGHFNTGSGPSLPPPDDKAEMFGIGAEVRWGPVTLGTDAAVFGLGVDLLGRAVVILDGSALFGAGSIAALWFDAHGAPVTGIFEILSGFQPGPSTWFETSPLIGGGLALRRMDAPSGSSQDERRTSRWLLVLPSGTSSTLPVPAWLDRRPDTNMQLGRSGRAYVFLPWATDVNVCGQQAEVVSPSGNSCGKLDFPVDSRACRTRELRLGLDGTVMQMLPASREQNDPPGSTVYTCTLRYWPAALR